MDLYKVGSVFPMVVVSILLHAEFGPNDHSEDAPHFIYPISWYVFKVLHAIAIFGMTIQENRENHIKGEFVKIRGFILVIIFVNFTQE